MQSAVVGANYREERPKILVDAVEAHLADTREFEGSRWRADDTRTRCAPDNAIGTAGSLGHLNERLNWAPDPNVCPIGRSRI